MQILCIYHADCIDGIASAWVVKKFYERADVVFTPAKYGAALPVTEGFDLVVIVDFSFTLEQTKELVERGLDVIMIDHHERAAEFAEVNWPDNFTLKFDKSCSGAILTWHHFFKGWAFPELLGYVSDRDTWQFRFEETRNVMDAVFSYPLNIDTFDRLVSLGDKGIPELYSQGCHINRKKQVDLNQISQNAWKCSIYGYMAIAVNASMIFRSDICDKLLQENPDVHVAACYQEKGDRLSISLRSRKGEVDVNRIANKYGGGGHREAAGFSINRVDRDSVFESADKGLPYNDDLPF